MKKSKTIALALASVLAVGALSACGGGGSAATPSAAPATSSAPAASSSAAPATSAAPAASSTGRDSIIIATENETPSLTVEKHNAVAGSYMNILTHNGLTKVNIDMTTSPDLAKSIEADPADPSVWHVELHEGVQFHNGQILTADDVKTSLDTFRNVAEVAQYTNTVKSIDVVDDLNLILHTDGPSATLMNDLTHHGNDIVPKALLEGGHDFNADPVGTGPYKFKSWVFGDKLEFERFDDYFDKDHVAKIKDMTWRIIPEGPSRTIALEAGDADFVVEVATIDIPRMQANPDIEVIIKAGTSHNYMMANSEKFPFDNEDFRKAVDYAIDKESVVVGALDGLAVAVYNQSPQGFPGQSDENLNTYDPEKAKELLASSGVDLSKVNIQVICSNDQKRRCAEIMQADLAAVGIKMEIVSMDLTTYLDVTTTGDYEAAIGGYTSDTLLGYLAGVFHSNSINASNKSRLNNKEVDALIDKAKATIDEDERVGYLQEVNALLNSITPQVPIYQDTVKRAFNANLGGVDVSAGGTLYFNDVYWK